MLFCFEQLYKWNYSPEMKLPNLNIPKFSGAIENRLEHINYFETSIHQEKSLYNVRKFGFLKSLLCNPAYNVIEGFPLTE